MAHKRIQIPNTKKTKKLLMQESIQEFLQVYSDPLIKQYSSPTYDEMIEIIHKAEQYTGEWYHSAVNLYDLDHIPEQFHTTQYLMLHHQIEKLNQDAGIYITYDLSS